MKKKILSMFLACCHLTPIYAIDNPSLNVSDPQYQKQVNNFNIMLKQLELLMNNTNKSHFEKWISDMWAFTTMSCKPKNYPNPKLLETYKVHSSGSFSMLDKQLCESIATQGLNPACLEVAISQSHPLTSTPKGFYRNQGIFVDPKEPIPKPNTELVMALYCTINPNVRGEGMKQFYVGKAKLDYSQITDTYFTTSLGNIPVKQTSVFLVIDGLKTKFGPTNLIQVK